MQVRAVWECAVLLVCCLWESGNSFNSNAIKTGSGAAQSLGHPPISITPQVIIYDSVHQNHAIEQFQLPSCLNDQDCPLHEFCSGSHTCLTCRRRRKRCLRDIMCCPGNRCSNGMCIPNDEDDTHGEIEEMIVERWNHQGKHTTMDTKPKRVMTTGRTHSVKGQEGDMCLRSSDCSEGLCCARHFWSKICKPVLKEGQVCTKHKRKGSHGLEIFQRCDCAQGFSCRIQRGHNGSTKTSRLHTCQRH
ncbi:dickkopf-related protein 1b [Callorhinchus milii]|uniref:Dickkopf WNT signaling pathway inhibitor 1b n=1 Tax=Callorhinchus milii TaxID=7868 RepID=A0A4W3JTE5_CALMI|nr:dickkopf-related protein 1b [Callorhinchus milii]|eukprot:gi/632936512/ref/XP_007895204.1/ PREDICTED: dickkopf-related protein 1 [Callorhinchus milii]